MNISGKSSTAATSLVKKTRTSGGFNPSSGFGTLNVVSKPLDERKGMISSNNRNSKVKKNIDKILEQNKKALKQMGSDIVDINLSER